MISKMRRAERKVSITCEYLRSNNTLMLHPCSHNSGYNQWRIEAARGHATSNSANIDSIVLNVTKNRDPCAACRTCRTAYTVEVLTFYTLSLNTLV